MRNGPSSPLLLDDCEHGGGAERADELVLEIGFAHEEAELLQVGAREIRPHAGALERPQEGAFLADVAEARQLHVEAAGADTARGARPTACAPPIGTIATPSASRSRP